MRTAGTSVVGLAVGLASMSAAHAGAIIDSYTPLVANDNIARTNSTFPNPQLPFVLAPGVTQRILFQGDSPNGLTLPRGGNSAQGSSFDQIAINTTGPDAGRYLFTVTETTEVWMKGRWLSRRMARHGVRADAPVSRDRS